MPPSQNDIPALPVPPRRQRFWVTAALPLATLLLGVQLGSRLQVLRGPLEDKQESSLSWTASGTVITDPEQEVDLSLLWEAWRSLQSHYIAPEELKIEPLVYGAVEGMVRGVGDPYTVFMTPKQDQEFRQSLEGDLEGIGAELHLQDGFITVVATIKGSPAERAGLLPSDILEAIDGVSIEGQNLLQVVQRIRGPKGTSVKLRLLHEGRDVREVTITRDKIHIPSAEGKVLETQTGSLGLLTVNQFGDGTMEEVRDALRLFEGKPLKGIVLDLRSNGGGYLDGAVELVSLFLREGVVATLERRGEEPQAREVEGEPVYPDLPLAVLINQSSASASEIAAGALQESKRATVIGMKSFGKGTVQEIYDLPGGSSMRITVARWRTPSGKNLAKEGITPDIVIDRTAEDLQMKRDPQLDRAVAWILGKGGN